MQALFIGWIQHKVIHKAKVIDPGIYNSHILVCTTVAAYPVHRSCDNTQPCRSFATWIAHFRATVYRESSKGGGALFWNQTL